MRRRRELVNSSYSAEKEEYATSASFLLLINIIQQLLITGAQTNKINLVFKNNLMLFCSIPASATQRLAVSSAMSALTTPAEIHAW